MSTLVTEQPGLVHVLEVAVSDQHTPAAARHWLTSELAGLVPQDTVDDAELIVSELVTNAVRHAGGRILASVQLVDGGVRVTVHDHGSAGEWAAPGGESAGRGRGLIIAMALAVVDVSTGLSGTTVTALIQRSAIGAAA